MEQGFYRSLVDNASDLIQSVGPDGHFVYVNQTWRRVLGYSESEVAGLTLWDIIQPDCLPRCRVVFQRVMAGEAVNNVETVFITRERKPVAVEGNVSCQIDGGKVVATLGIFRDISGRKKSEAALARSEANYRELAENTPVAIATTDIAGNFVYVNSALCRRVGYSREELIGKPFTGFLHPEDRGLVLALFREALNRPQGILNLEFRAVHKDGRIIHMYSAPAVLRRGDEICGFSAFMEDITERKRTAEALRESEEKYRGLVNNVKLGIVRSVIGPPGRALEVNPAMEMITGYAREELLAMDLVRLCARSEDREAIIRELRSTSEAVVRELRWRKKDGSEVLVRSRVTPVKDGGGEILYLDAITEDITERWRLAEALRESEEKYRGLVNNVRLGILRSTAGPPGRAIEFNPAIEQISGYSREEILKMDIDRLYSHPEEREVILRELRATKDVVLREIQWRKKDGSEVVVLARMTPIRDSAGELIYLDAIIEDVTERRSVLEALKDSEEKYRGLVNNVRLGILRSTIGPPGRILEFNPAMELITGYSRDELLVMDMVRLYARPEDREALIRESRSAREAIVREFRWRKKDGSEVLVRDRVVPVRDNNGEILYLDAIIEDITERRRLSEAVRRAKEFAENIIDSSVDGILAFDRDFRYTIWNPGMEANTGVKRAEVIGRVAFEAFPFIVETGEDEFFRAALQGKVSVARDRPYLVPQTGRTGFFEGYYSPLYGEGGRIEGGLAVIRNTTVQVTAQRELEEKNQRLDAQNEELQIQREELMAQQQEILEKTGELIKANHLKSQFLANMSHELRTPLNVIIGFTQLMVDGVPGKINAEQGQCLADILDSSQHLLNLINEVLDLSKIESGKTELKLEDLDLAGLVPTAVRLIMPILRPKGQTLETRVEAALPPVRADKAKLGQVLRNLLANASKFSPEGSGISIEASSQDGWCRISVIDQGPGVKQEDQERIFDPFYQLDYTPASGKAGTGLGLSVVKQIVERHGGQVWVESEYGRGSAFIFTLPLAAGGTLTEEINP